MEDKNFQEKYEANENKGGSFFRFVGIFVLSLLLATLTVITINL